MNIFIILHNYPDSYRLGQQGVLATNANFSEVRLEDGLYSLGEVKEDGFLASVCVKGKVVEADKKGILLLYIIRETNGILMVEYIFDVVLDEDGSNCRINFNNQHAPKKHDILAVFLGSNTLARMNSSFSPVLIAYKSEAANFKLFEGSNVFGRIYEIPKLQQKMQTTVTGELSREKMTQLSETILNVQVTIISKFPPCT